MLLKKHIYSLILLAFFLVPPLNAEQKTIKILGIGNSFTVDAFEDYLAPLAAADGVDLILGYPYKGGTDIDEHWSYVENDEAVYDYRKIVNGQLTKTASTKLIHAIQDEDWDYIFFQTNYTTGGFYDSYFPYINQLMDYVKDNKTNPDAIFGIYMCWAYDSNSGHAGFALYNKDQMKMYNDIVSVTNQLAQTVGVDLIIPAGTAIQNGRTSCIGDRFNRDGFHLNYDWGRYTASCTWYEKITGNNVLNNTYRPATLSEHRAEICRRAAHAAIQTPNEITEIPDDVPHENNINTDLPVYINFTNVTGVTQDTHWNDLRQASINSSVANLVNTEGNETDITVKISRAFGGINPYGASETNTRLDMDSIISSTAFWGNGAGVVNSKSVPMGEITLSGLEHERLYNFTIFASYTKGTANYETAYTFTGTNRRTGYLNPHKNTEELLVVEGIQPGRDGRITLSVTNGPNNTDETKMFFLGAMMITPQEETAEVPYNTAWNGYTLEEPELLSGVYRITSGAELAWYAAKVNGVLDGTRQTTVSCILLEDVDLGGYDWQPIADGQYLPSNSSNYPYYAGTFDGNFKKISGLKLNADKEYCGFIGSGNNCTVKNVHFAGELIVTATVAGGSKEGVGVIAAYTTSSGTYTNCSSEVDIKMNTSSANINKVGTLFGRFNNGTANNLSYSGTVTSQSGKTVKAAIGSFNAGTYTNIHYLDGDYLTGAESGKVTTHTADEYYSGKVAHLLQGGQATQVWGQTLDGQSQTYPNLTTDAAYKVYEAMIYSGTSTPVNGYSNADGLSAKGENVMVYIDEEIAVANISDNVVVKSGDDYVANKIQLTDGYDFYIPENPVFTASTVTYSRECFMNGTPETIVLPFAPTRIESDESSTELMIATYDAINYINYSVNFTKKTDWAANTPYLLYVEGAAGNESKKTHRFEANNISLEISGTNGVFCGIYQTKTAASDHYLLDTDNTRFTSSNDGKCQAFRAYLHLDTDPGQPLSITYDSDISVGIEEIETESTLIEDFNIYSIDGRLVKVIYRSTLKDALHSLSRGIYIVNGKKVFKTLAD